MIPNVSQINSKPLIFPNSGKGLVCDTFSGKMIFHNSTQHFPNEFRIFYKLWKEPTFSVPISAYMVTADIGKAFDSVDHNFLFATLKNLD